MAALAHRIVAIEQEWHLAPGGFGLLDRAQQARLLGYDRWRMTERRRQQQQQRAQQLAQQARERQPKGRR